MLALDKGFHSRDVFPGPAGPQSATVGSPTVVTAGQASRGTPALVTRVPESLVPLGRGSHAIGASGASVGHMPTKCHGWLANRGHGWASQPSHFPAVALPRTQTDANREV
jgi:hypothetical protein